jgi:hypothetical protein
LDELEDRREVRGPKTDGFEARHASIGEREIGGSIWNEPCREDGRGSPQGLKGQLREAWREGDLRAD